MKKPELDLTNVDGNAFSLLAKARRVAKDNGLDWAKIQADAVDKDYDHLLTVLNEHFDVTIQQTKR